MLSYSEIQTNTWNRIIPRGNSTHLLEQHCIRQLDFESRIFTVLKADISVFVYAVDLVQAMAFPFSLTTSGLCFFSNILVGRRKEL